MYQKLKINKEFRRAYGCGKSFVAPSFVSYILKCRGDNIRFGITVSKKMGCAVERNRAKRLITAAFRECYPHIKKTGCDIVFVARKRILTEKSYNIAATMKSHFIATDMWEENDK